MTTTTADPLMTQFDTTEALSAGVARAIADSIRQAVAERGRASIAVSGGSTPKKAFAKLATEALPWPQVVITLVDDRWVPANNPRSNHLLLNETLLAGAKAAKFVPLYTGDVTAEAGLAKAEEKQKAVPRPFDLVLLGMGGDGHTASLFPGGDHLAEALDMNSGKTLLPMAAPGAPEPRITLTLPAILNARRLLLMMAGEDKMHAYKTALKDGPVEDMPVRAVLRQDRVPVDVYYA